MLALVSCQVIVFNVLLVLLSRNKYPKVLEKLEQKEYPLRKLFLPGALLLLSYLKKSYDSGYDRRLHKQLSQLKGFKEADFYLVIHWASKLAYVLLGSLMLGLFWVASPGIDFLTGFFSFLVLLVIFYAPDYELSLQAKKQKHLIQWEFPSFLHKLVLLLNAGLTVQGAWDKALAAAVKNSPLYTALYQVSLEIKGGKPEIQAYEDLARRCSLPEITKFVTIIIQNTRKGSFELAAILRKQAEECWQDRVRNAKKAGEEASTKMLLPMMLMLLAVLLVVAAPAILAMRNL